MGEKGPGRAALSSGGSPSSGTALALPDLSQCSQWEPAGIAGRCQGRASARAATPGIWSEAEGIFRSEQRRARTTCRKNLPGVHSCARRTSLGAHILYGSHGAAPGPGPAHTHNYSCSTGMGAFSMGLFQLLCHPPDFIEPLLSCQEFLAGGCVVTPSSASEGKTRGQKNGLDLKSRCPKHPQPQPGCSWS